MTPPPPLNEGLGAPGELSSTDPSAEHAPLELLVGPPDPVPLDGPP